MSDTIKFSALPGAYERHLQRKYRNPLFPEADQFPPMAEIEQAREKDQQDLRSFFDAFEETVQQAAKLDSSVEADTLLDLKTQLERLYVTSTSLAGDLAQHQAALIKLIRVCMSSIEKGAADDPIAQQKLRDETEARAIYFDLLNTALVADLMRGDEIVQANELVPTLLSQPQVDLITSLALFEPEQLNQLIIQTTQFIATLDEATKQQTESEQRLLAMQTVYQQPAV